MILQVATVKLSIHSKNHWLFLLYVTTHIADIGRRETVHFSRMVAFICCSNNVGDRRTRLER